MNSSTPENATIASNVEAISARVIPMIAPCRYTFSRPVRSGWNPAATSMTHLIDAFRAVLLERRAPDAAFAMTFIASIGLFGAAWLLFHAAEFDFAENL